jgi:RNA polymerase sigma-70 factor (ECF subfamily)
MEKCHPGGDGELLVEREHQALAALIERCNDGDRRAWEELYSRYHPLVARVVSRYGSPELGDSEDAIQEVFFNLFMALRHYDPSRPLEAYVLEIARRVRVSMYRKQVAAKRGGTSRGIVPLDAHNGSEGGYIAIAAPQKDQEAELSERQEVRLLRAALAALSESCKRLLELRYDKSLRFKEMAEILGEKEGALRVKVQRCVASLGRKFTALKSAG